MSTGMPRPLSRMEQEPSDVDGDLDARAIAGEVLVDGVVQHFENAMVQAALIRGRRCTCPGAGERRRGPPVCRFSTHRNHRCPGQVNQTYFALGLGETIPRKRGYLQLIFNVIKEVITTESVPYQAPTQYVGVGWARRAFSILFLRLVLALAGIARCHNAAEVWAGAFLFCGWGLLCAHDEGADGDGASVQPVHHHVFENYPQGIDSHTTAPMDYLIAALAWMSRPWAAQYLDFAGAIVSPLLGLATVLFIWFWFGPVPFRGAALFLLRSARS